jgi:hypothetical protein
MLSYRRLSWLTLLVLILALVIPYPIQGQDKPQSKLTSRTLLYPAKVEDVAESIRPFVNKLLAREQKSIDAKDAKPTGIFARIITRKYVLDGKTLKKGSTLGTKPFVFTTLPETLYGRNLLEVFSMIGYSAEEVLTREHGEEKVVVLFRWEKEIVLHSDRGGKLPDAWHSAVYPATWDNLFALVEKMASDKNWNYVKEADKPSVLNKLQLQSLKEGQFLLSFPDAGKKRIKSSNYSVLRSIKGSDWEYRQFLDRSMGASEHFSGDGKSKPTMNGQSKPPTGFPEFLGPNRELMNLPEIAVIGLGKLQVME